MTWPTTSTACSRSAVPQPLGLRTAAGRTPRDAAGSLAVDYWQLFWHTVVMYFVAVADWPVESVTWTVKDVVPAVFGTPRMRPTDERLSPDGSLPPTTCHVAVPTTPLAVRFAL